MGGRVGLDGHGDSRANWEAVIALLGDDQRGLLDSRLPSPLLAKQIADCFRSQDYPEGVDTSSEKRRLQFQSR